AGLRQRALAGLPRRLDRLASAASPGRRRNRAASSARADRLVTLPCRPTPQRWRGAGVVPLAPAPRRGAALAGEGAIEHGPGVADAVRAGGGARYLRLPGADAGRGVPGARRLAARPRADPGRLRAGDGPRLGRRGAAAAGEPAGPAGRPAA